MEPWGHPKFCVPPVDFGDDGRLSCRIRLRAYRKLKQMETWGHPKFVVQLGGFGEVRVAQFLRQLAVDLLVFTGQHRTTIVLL